MQIEDFKSNSHKSKEQPESKQIQKVVSGSVKTRKKSELRKFTDVFISDDIESVKSYVIMDVIVPAVKKAISDVVTNGIDMLLYGESGGGYTRTKSGPSKISYEKYSKPSRYASEPRSTAASRARSSYDYDTILYNNRGEAEMVLQQLRDLVDNYGLASVHDMYELAGVTGDYTATKYGWIDVSSAVVAHDRDGWIIKMPKASPID